MQQHTNDCEVSQQPRPDPTNCKNENNIVNRWIEVLNIQKTYREHTKMAHVFTPIISRDQKIIRYIFYLFFICLLESN